MSRLSTILSSLPLLAIACAGPAAQFETSVSAPEERENYEPVAPYQTSPRYLAHPTFESEVTMNKFLLALENGASEQLESVLAPGASLREESSGTGSSALPALLTLARSWSGVSAPTAAPTGLSQAVPFGPAEIVEISPHNADAWATVFVAGPPEVEGYWKVHLESGSGGHQIQEVIVPKSH